MQAHPHQPTHISEMMQRLGIEPGGGVVARWTMHYTTVFHRCEACAGKQPCQDWLDRTPGQVSFAPRFCPSSASSCPTTGPTAPPAASRGRAALNHNGVDRLSRRQSALIFSGNFFQNAAHFPVPAGTPPHSSL